MIVYFDKEYFEINYELDDEYYFENKVDYCDGYTIGTVVEDLGEIIF